MRSSDITWRQGYRTAIWVAMSGILASLFLAGCVIISARKLDLITGNPHAPGGSEPPYPTRLSEITPIPCHSHNDFWRDVPLQSALEAGCIGVEADVWPYEGDLFIGHSRGGLVTSRTLAALYVEPLIQLLQQKPSRASGTSHGIYDAEPSQTLVLLVDVKADLTEAWPLLLDAVQPLRQQGWLSHLDKGERIMAAITVVVTGDASGAKLVNVTTGATSGLFLDAPLHKLSADHSMANGYYWASASFPKTVGWLWTGRLRSSQIEIIRQHVRMAHSHGLKVRYWGLPTWPGSAQKHVLNVLIQEGADLINVDNIEAIVPYIKEQSLGQLPSSLEQP